MRWLPELGLGYYPVTAGHTPYDEAYFARYVRQAMTPIGRALMAERVRFVHRFYTGALVDVGIGSGAFVETRGGLTYGYDVCPPAREWLQLRGRWQDPYEGARAVSLWDVIEHLPDPGRLLVHVTEWVFLSTPIYRDMNHVLRSKHFRPDEHCWYFTRDGLVWYMDRLGWELAEENDEETKIGREDIGSFAFRRNT